MKATLHKWAIGLVCALAASGTMGSAEAGEVRHGGNGHVENPVWSHDGKYVAFELRKNSDGIDLYFAPIRGTIADQARLVALPGSKNAFSGSQVAANPTWRHDGLIMFEGTNDGGMYRLYISQPPSPTGFQMLDLEKDPGNQVLPSLSGDGKLVVYVSGAAGKGGDLHIYNSASGAVERVTNTDEPEMFPAFSPDGKKLIYMKKVRMQQDLFSMDIATKSVSPFKGGKGDQTRPIITADGTVVYFSSNDDDSWTLAATDLSGESTKTLAKGVRLPKSARPALSPDGKWVAYSFDDPVKGDSIYISALDGSRTIEVKTEYKACGEPAIGNQDGRIVLAYTALPSAKAAFRMLRIQDITQEF
jgi:TolB protein